MDANAVDASSSVSPSSDSVELCCHASVASNECSHTIVQSKLGLHAAVAGFVT